MNAPNPKATHAVASTRPGVGTLLIAGSGRQGHLTEMMAFEPDDAEVLANILTASTGQSWQAMDAREAGKLWKDQP